MGHQAYLVYLSHMLLPFPALQAPEFLIPICCQISHARLDSDRRIPSRSAEVAFLLSLYRQPFLLTCERSTI